MSLLYLWQRRQFLIRMRAPSSRIPHLHAKSTAIYTEDDGIRCLGRFLYLGTGIRVITRKLFAILLTGCAKTLHRTPNTHRAHLNPEKKECQTRRKLIGNHHAEQRQKARQHATDSSCLYPQDVH